MQEFDVTDLIRLLWKRKSFILKTTLICLCFGVLVVLLSPKQYTSISTFIPQKPQTNSEQRALDAYLQKENPNIYETNEILNASLYPQVIENISFRKKIIYMPVCEGHNGEKISLVEYLSSDKYRPFHLGQWIRKYTIDLPATIRMANGEDIVNENTGKDTSLITLSQREEQAIDMLQKGVTLWIGEDNALLNVTTEDPLITARLAQNILSLLKEEVTNYRSTKIEEQWAFLKQQQEIAIQELESKRKEMTNLQTTRHSFPTQNIDITKSFLLAEYQQIFNNYQNINQRLERLKLKKQDTTPAFTMLEEIYVPYQASNTKQGIIITAFVALGLFLGMVLVITLPYIAEITRSKFLMHHFSVKEDQEKDVE